MREVSVRPAGAYDAAERGTDQLDKTPGTRDADEFRLEEFLPYELVVAANHTSRLFARHYSKEFGLSIAEWRVMAVVGRLGDISPGGVVERSEMDKVKVSRAAAGLIAAGLLEQSPDPADGRVRRLHLTARGERVHQAIIPRARALEARLAEGLSAAEWNALRHLLRRLTEYTRRLEEADSVAMAE
jgi:DNA-binding MarR family transcriptional regulator